MKKHIWFILVSIVIAFILLYSFWLCNITFKSEAFKELPALLSGYLIISLLIERFIGVVFLKEEYKEVNELSTQVVDLKEEKQEIFKANRSRLVLDNSAGITAFDNVLSSKLNSVYNNISKAKIILDEKKSERDESFNYYSFFLGLILSSAGFKFFANIIDVAGRDICSVPIYSKLYVGVDVFLTAILFAGGSKLILELIERFKNG